MEIEQLRERYVKLDRGWRACLIASAIVLGELMVSAI
jgi:hypothetical protein